MDNIRAGETLLASILLREFIRTGSGFFAASPYFALTSSLTLLSACIGKLSCYTKRRKTKNCKEDILYIYANKLIDTGEHNFETY